MPHFNQLIRLREAGAVLVCKTTMPDYGMLSSGLSSFHQQRGRLTRNPWGLVRYELDLPQEWYMSIGRCVSACSTATSPHCGSGPMLRGR